MNITHLVLALLFTCDPGRSAAVEISVTTGGIAPLPITAHTGMKPQSKLWKHDGHWWGCFADSTGTHIWRLGGDRWIQSTTMTSHTDVRADVLPSGGLVEILLFRGESSELIRCYFSQKGGVYGTLHLSEDSPRIPVLLDPGVETATIARDNDGRLWIASDGQNEVNVRWMDRDSTSPSGPITLADNISEDDICVIARLGDGSVGVLWSNQNTQRYGFRRHVSTADPEDWFPDEIPAGASAIDHGEGMSDDHLNVAIGSDGTLFATVKSSYDTEGMPLVSALVRRPHHRWDPLYNVDDEGSRGVMVLDESQQLLLAVYTSYRDNAIVLRHAPIEKPVFGGKVTLLKRPRINNVSAPRHVVTGRFPIVASQGDSLMHTVMVEVE